MSAEGNILLIGSCLSENLALRICEWLRREKRDPDSLHHLLVNHLSVLPDEPEAPIDNYSFQIIQPPLRGVLHESHYLGADLMNPEALNALETSALSQLSLFLENYLGYNTRHGLTSFVTGFIVPQRNPLGRMMPRHSLSNLQHLIRRLNERLEKICLSRTNVHYVDLDEIASRIGKRHILDDSIHALSHGALAGDFDFEHDLKRLQPPEPFSKSRELKTEEFLDDVWHDILHRYEILTRRDPLKIVIVDLDDTLWRGVLAEDGIHPHGLEGWPLGVVEALQFLKMRGILLAIASKNYESLIREKWDEIFQRRILLEDFASIRINWNPKVQSVREILEETNLLPGNALFIDDNPVERDEVGREFVGIRILGEDLYGIREYLLTAPELDVPFITTESGRRTEMIQAQGVREQSRKSMSRGEFLQSLNLKVVGHIIKSPSDQSFERARELLNKTNQFNTTGRRWTPEEIGRFFAEGGVFYTFNVTDRFTAYGLVGLLMVQGNCIRQFVMSCRVVGLDVEQQMLRSVIDRINTPEVTAEYVRTEKNHLCADLYPKNGFELRDGLWVYTKPEKKGLFKKFMTIQINR
ncbi:MAG: HAD-IIIC family phosphatase [Verrucomicrobia bacterium]|nr:HAD-IIIC family phosphatase [Verrucomicrobiota bacterium]